MDLNETWVVSDTEGHNRPRRKQRRCTQKTNARAHQHQHQHQHYTTPHHTSKQVRTATMRVSAHQVDMETAMTMTKPLPLELHHKVPESGYIMGGGGSGDGLGHSQVPAAVDTNSAREGQNGAKSAQNGHTNGGLSFASSIITGQVGSDQKASIFVDRREDNAATPARKRSDGTTPPAPAAKASPSDKALKDAMGSKTLLGMSKEMQKLASRHDQLQEDFENQVGAYQLQVQGLRVSTATLQSSNDQIKQTQGKRQHRHQLRTLLQQNADYQRQVERSSQTVKTMEADLKTTTDDLCKVVMHKSILQTRLSKEIKHRTSKRPSSSKPIADGSPSSKDKGSHSSRRRQRSSNKTSQRQPPSPASSDTLAHLQPLRLQWKMKAPTDDWLSGSNQISSSLQLLASEDEEYTLDHLSNLLLHKPKVDFVPAAAAAAGTMSSASAIEQHQEADLSIRLSSSMDSTGTQTSTDEHGNKIYRTRRRSMQVEIHSGPNVDDGATIITCEAFYSGPLIDDKPSGIGSLWFTNGDHYLGEFVKGEMHGLGTFSRKHATNDDEADGQAAADKHKSSDEDDDQVGASVASEVFRGSFVQNYFVQSNVTLLMNDDDSMA